MENKRDIKQVLTYVQSYKSDFEYEEEKIQQEISEEEKNQSSLLIKILSIFGGYFAGIFLILALFFIGIYKNEGAMLALGIIFIISTILISRFVKNSIVDAFSLTLIITGFVMINFSYENSEDWQIAFLLSAINLVVFLLSRSFLISFISIIGFHACIFYMLFELEVPSCINIIVIFDLLVLYFLQTNESKLITENNFISYTFQPIRIAFIFTLLIGFFTVSEIFDYKKFDFYPWISTIGVFVALLFFLPKLFKKIEITETVSKILIIAFTFCVFLITIFEPTILGAIFILLLCFYANYKTGFSISLIALIYFVCQYYYDLSFTLLTKSILMMISGVLFLVIYLFIQKKWFKNEKV
ncbi:DUF4401 domain-containing protein [Aureivirga sp. CE67]|uniref:DUF4401 domain-containing protein n=1 Tax=Aureivirga sp. CE67 TaxID=1788983 RepID=UPI0018C9942F|nr:DUF4401 domain-containing protein [Aureivirga sp. CE67]